MCYFLLILKVSKLNFQERAFKVVRPITIIKIDQMEYIQIFSTGRNFTSQHSSFKNNLKEILALNFFS